MAHPVRERLRGFALVTELLGRDWARGRLQEYPEVCFELSFEPIPYSRLPGTSITYLGIMSGRRNIFEFQCGQLVTPHVTEEDYARYAFPFIERLRGYSNAQVSFMRAMTQDEFNRR